MKFRLNYVKMPFFEADGGAGAGSAGGEGIGNGGNEGNGDSSDNGGNDAGDDKGNNDPNIEKLIELRFQKAMAEEKKKSAALNRELEKMKKEKMTADELKKYEDEQRNTQLAEREKAITEKENRYYAVGAIKKAGLDDGSDTALKIVDLVMAEDTKGIDGKVSALNELVNKLVDAKVDAKFKAAGRSPNGGAGGSGEGAKDKNSLAEKLGKQRAEQAKKSNEILKHYL